MSCLEEGVEEQPLKKEGEWSSLESEEGNGRIFWLDGKI